MNLLQDHEKFTLGRIVRKDLAVWQGQQQRHREGDILGTNCTKFLNSNVESRTSWLYNRLAGLGPPLSRGYMWGPKHWEVMKWCLMSSDILGTSCEQCRSMVQYSFTSTETRRLIRTDNPGRPPRLSHSSWTMLTLRGDELMLNVLRCHLTY